MSGAASPAGAEGDAAGEAPRPAPAAGGLDGILRLGEVDIRLSEARRRRRQAAEQAAPQEARVADARRTLERLAEQLKQGTLEAKRQEGEARAKQAEIEKTQAAINQCRNNDEYKTLLEQLERRKAELSLLETAVLEAYEAQDRRQAEKAQLETRRKALEQDLAEARKRVAAATGEVDLQLAGLEAERAAAREALDAQHAAVYEKVLAQHGDSAVADIVDQFCQGCFVKVRPEQVSQVRGGQIVTCFDCGRILVFRGGRTA